jgi:diguanylate cyclase (GGDEF)-like protein/PAS domain S-box-containing protein
MTLRPWLGPFRRTLKLRIAVAAGLFVVAALALVTATIVAILAEDGAQQAAAAQVDLARRMAAQIGARLADRQDALATLASALPPDGATDVEGSVAWLAAQHVAPRLFRSMFIATPAGEFVARSEHGESRRGSTHIGDRPYFVEAVSTGRPVVSSALTSRANGRPVVVMLHPVKDASGRTTAVVGASVSLDGPNGLSDVDAGLDPSRRTVIVDADLRVIGHEDPARRLRPARDLPELRVFLEHDDRRLRGDDASGAKLVDGQVIAWATVPALRWYLLEIVDTAAMRAAAARAYRKALASSFVLALMAGAGIWLLCAWLFLPMAQLRTRAMRVLTESVDLDHGWPSGTDEIGELSRAFRHILRERSSAEQTSLKMLGQLQAILDNASVGIAFTRAERFELVSPSLAELTGYTRGELFARPMRLLAVNAEGYAWLSDRIAAAEGRFDLEFPIRRKDGSQVWVRTVGSAIDPEAPTAGTIWIVEDISEARRLRAQLSWSATRDPLTELINRREFEARLKTHLSNPDRPPGAVMFMDLDGFKQVNDTGGHAAGDRMLCDIARLLERQVRQVDRVARLGGDEFAILLVGCPLDTALEIAERIRSAVHDHRLELASGSLSVGVSIGVVGIDEGVVEPSHVLQAADTACYAAKHGGRDTVRVWDAAARSGRPA